MQNQIRRRLVQMLALPAVHAGMSVVTLILLAMMNAGMTIVVLLGLRVAVDVLGVARGLSARVLVRDTVASAILLGLAAALAILLDPSLHPTWPVAASVIGFWFRVACAWAVVKSLWRHPLWSKMKHELPLKKQLSFASVACAALIVLMPTFGIPTETVVAAIVIHLTPSAW